MQNIPGKPVIQIKKKLGWYHGYFVPSEITLAPFFFGREDIMEFINKEPIIYVVSGKARSGKNSVCEFIKNHYKDLKVINLAYADTLKDYAMKITSWD